MDSSDRKEILRDFIIERTAKEMSARIGAQGSMSEAEMSAFFIRMLENGQAKIGVLPHEDEEEKAVQCIILTSTGNKDAPHEFMALETGRTLTLDPDSARVFTLSEDQYRRIYGMPEKS